MASRAMANLVQYLFEVDDCTLEVVDVENTIHRLNGTITIDVSQGDLQNQFTSLVNAST